MKAFGLNKQMITSILCALPFIVSAQIEYEPNNTLDDAQVIFNTGKIQTHAFDYQDDEDWLVFYANKGKPYEIEITNVGSGVNPAIELYNDSGEVEVNLFDFNFAGEGELLSWESPADGFYYIRVINVDNEFDSNAQYDIKVFLPFAPQNGEIEGTVVDECTQLGIGNVVLKAEGGQKDQSFSAKNGAFELSLNPGSYTVTTNLAGYQNQAKSITIKEARKAILNFDILPEAGCPDASVEPANELTASEREQLKQQAVAFYDDSSRILTIKDVRVGEDILAVSLKAQDDFSFIITATEYISNGILDQPAFFDFDSLLADIPQVFAFDQLYFVQLKQRDEDGAFVIQKADPLPK